MLNTVRRSVEESAVMREPLLPLVEVLLDADTEAEEELVVVVADGAPS